MSLECARIFLKLLTYHCVTSSYFVMMFFFMNDSYFNKIKNDHFFIQCDTSCTLTTLLVCNFVKI